MATMRKMMTVMLMGLAFTVAQVEAGAQPPRKDARKPAATTNRSTPAVKPGDKSKPSSTTRLVRPDVRPGGKTARPTTPSARPTTPATKPSGPSARPTTPSARPTTPSTRPTPPSARPSGPATKPGVHSSRPASQPPRPDHGYKPAPRPGAGPGYRPAPRPPRPPKPVIVTRPIYGSIIAAAVAAQLIRSAVRSATRPVYYRVEANGLRLSHSYVPVGTEYYYQDGVFYIIDTYGQYRTIVPPTGALVQYLPDDYTTFRRSGELFYRVDDTVYALTLIDGNPYFEVLGQL